MRSDHLRVPGAHLNYELRGDGPVLLLVPGGGGDAGVFDDMAEVLQRYFTVVALDPRGYSRSTLDPGSSHDQPVTAHSDDAHRLVTHLTDEPAFVAGTSNGAIVGLDLLARHPESVAALFAHEPPCFATLDDAAEHRALIEEVYHLFRTDGLAAASARFTAAIGATMAPAPDLSELSPRQAEMWQRLAGNGPRMMAHDLRPFTAYVPNYAALEPVRERVIPAVGRESRGHLPSRPAAEIAERLGVCLVECPGAHNGIRTDAANIAGIMLDSFASETRLAPDELRTGRPRKSRVWHPGEFE